METKPMSEEFSYQDYVNDERFLADYNAYQARYAAEIRESDKVIISMVRDLVKQAEGRRLRVLDIGCSTGNLLLHMKRMVPDAEYFGGDLARSSLEICRANPDLAGVSFEHMDIMELPVETFDVILVNAVLYMFDDAQYQLALASLFQGLAGGGLVIIYDFAHPFVHQNLIIYETSVSHPDGLRLCFRSMNWINVNANHAGFTQINFYPFELPIELPKPSYDSEVVTYTVNTHHEGRMMFRGALYQPWCHMIARKG